MTEHKLAFEELEVQEEMMSDFWESYCYSFIITAGVIAVVAT